MTPQGPVANEYLRANSRRIRNWVCQEILDSRDLLFEILVPGGWSLAYIGTASGTTQRDAPEAYARRFRLGDKKEAAGVCRGRGDQPEMYGY